MPFCAYYLGISLVVVAFFTALKPIYHEIHVLEKILISEEAKIPKSYIR